MTPAPRIHRVRKRDGREVPYDRRKIEGAVASAESAAGEPSPGFPGEIADVVERLLERRFPDPNLAVPGIEEIQDLVERALVEMGAAAVAKAYILYREKRAQVRAALLVRDDRPDSMRGLPRGGAHVPRVEAKDKVEAWSKGKIVAALMSEADLPRERAETVAARVEARVFAAGSRSISTALVREMVDNELVDLGLDGALRRQRPIGVPRHDLRAALFDPRSVARVEAIVAGEVLGRFAMEDLLPPYVGDLVRGGDLEFEDLSLPHLPLALAIPLESVAATRPSAEAAAALLPEIGRLARSVSRVLALEGAEPLIEALAGSGAPPASGALAVWLAGLGAVARASGREIEIVLREPPASLLEPLVDALSALEREASRSSLPRIVLDSGPARASRTASGGLAIGGRSRAAAARLARRGILVPSWSAEGDLYAGPGITRTAVERGARSLGAVAILNLPRLARQAGAWREDALLESATALLGAALDGLSALDDFRRECADPATPRTRATSALALVGLRETLATLGDGELREEHAAKLVAFLAEAVDRRGRSREVPMVLTPRFGARAAERFARLDAAQFRLRQPWLFADPSGGESLEQPYGVGFELLEPRALLAAIGATPSAALHPASALEVLAGPPSTEPGNADARILDAWGTLHASRGRARGTAHALYALPPIFGSPSMGSPTGAGIPASAAEDLFAPEPTRTRADP